MIEDIARAKHAQYLRDELSSQPAGSSPALQPWDALDQDLKQANIDFARGVIEVLESRGLKVVRDPDLTDGAPVPRMFADADIEDLARAEHDRWMRDKAKAGWSYGAPRDNDRKLHPDMRPWDDLDEHARDKDRRPMQDLAAILATAGLRAVAADP